MDVPSSYRNKLQHAELKGKGIQFMAYDAAPDTPINHGNQIHMSVDLNDHEEAEHIFDTLSKGGQVHLNFREREWGHFGRCTDRFGINWMVNSRSEKFKYSFSILPIFIKFRNQHFSSDIVSFNSNRDDLHIM